jgi:hypothetical protein
MSREALIGIGACAVATIAMVVDHWLGDESGIDDPAAFFGSTAGSMIIAAILFGRVIPDTKRHPERVDRAARQGIVCSVLGLVTVPAIFLGFPVVLGSAGIALGLLGRDGRHRALATAAILIGALPVLAGLAYALQGGETPDDD